jgi:hypothetical protein
MSPYIEGKNLFKPWVMSSVRWVFEFLRFRELLGFAVN